MSNITKLHNLPTTEGLPSSGLSADGAVSNVIKFPSSRIVEDGVIDLAALKSNSRKLNPNLILPADEDTEKVLAPEHAAEPIKSMEDILRISQYLISNERYRDNMLFITGINFGLRVSDLRVLRFSDLINADCTFKERFPVFEQKTRNTRKKKKNRYVTVNTAVIEAVTLYLENTPNVKLSDYMFQSQSTNGLNKGQPISRVSVDRIMKGIGSDLGLGIRLATHSLRKTFCFHQMVMSRNDPRKLLLLQKMLGHSTSAQTLDYIGITADEIDEAYRNLNLGSLNHNYLIDSGIVESETLLA